MTHVKPSKSSRDDCTFGSAQQQKLEKIRIMISLCKQQRQSNYRRTLFKDLTLPGGEVAAGGNFFRRAVVGFYTVRAEPGVGKRWDWWSHNVLDNVTEGVGAMPLKTQRKWMKRCYFVTGPN